MITDEMKKCKVCGESKPATLEYFSKNANRLKSRCKDCIKKQYKDNPDRQKERNRKWYENNKERKKEYDRKYRKLNPEQKKENFRKWYEKNSDRKKENNHRWLEKNSERVKENRRKRYEANSELVKEQSRKWQKLNPERERVNKYRWRKNRMQEKPSYRILLNLRLRLRRAIKVKIKHRHTVELLGCTPDFLKSYLEQQFKPGMSWVNYGEWHIDHKIPCAAFDLSDPEQQKKCFHYTNLQPLWAIENFKKSNKIL